MNKSTVHFQMMASDELPRLSPGVRLSKDPISGEPILLYPEGHLVLNDTAYDVVTRCDGNTSLEQMVRALAAEYDTSLDILEQEVSVCLKELKEMRVVQFGEGGRGGIKF